MIVIDRIVYRAAIVPERKRADTPIEAAGEFRLSLVLKQKIKQRRTLDFGHILETHRVANIDVKRSLCASTVTPLRRVTVGRSARAQIGRWGLADPPPHLDGRGTLAGSKQGSFGRARGFPLVDPSRPVWS